MKHILIKYSNNTSVVHFDGIPSMGGDYTLCGKYHGSDHALGLPLFALSVHETSEKVTCIHCTDILRACKAENDIDI